MVTIREVFHLENKRWERRISHKRWFSNPYILYFCNSMSWTLDISIYEFCQIKYSKLEISKVYTYIRLQRWIRILEIVAKTQFLWHMENKKMTNWGALNKKIYDELRFGFCTPLLSTWNNISRSKKSVLRSFYFTPPNLYCTQLVGITLHCIQSQTRIFGRKVKIKSRRCFPFGRGGGRFGALGVKNHGFQLVSQNIKLRLMIFKEIHSKQKFNQCI